MIPEEEKTENRRFLEPDYSNERPDDAGLSEEEESEYVGFDLSDEGIEREMEIERQLDEQLALDDELDERNERRNETVSSPFGDSFGSNWVGCGSIEPKIPVRSAGTGPAPWEKAQQVNTRSGGYSWPNTPSTPSWGMGGSGSSYGGSWNTPTPARQEVSPTRMIVEKKAIICDVLDCLYESWESNGKPDVMPRGIFDIKPKFDVWDKILSLSPEMVYIIFPAPGVIPSFYGQSNVTLEYVAQSVGTYLRIPQNCCKVLEQMQEGLPKERILMGAIHDWRKVNEMVYIGVHSGKWGLSSRDLVAARACKLDYVDVFNLLEGKYELEQ